MFNILITFDPRYKIDRLLIHGAVEEVLKKEKVSGKIEVGVLIIGDRKMAQLNKQYRGLDQTTDVLSFPLESSTTEKKSLGFVKSPDKILRLGDIVVSYPQALRQAAENNILVEEEIVNLVKHGAMHLLGHHHELTDL